MPLIDDHNRLKEMVEKSPLLSSEKKMALLKRLPILDESEVVQLLQVFQMEKDKMLKMELAFEAKELQAKAEYLNALTEFEHAGIQHALKRVEEKEAEGNDQSLNKILSGLKNPKPKWGVVKFLFMFLILIGAVVIYFLMIRSHAIS